MSGGLANQQVLGQGFNWWIGQVADDSYWRDNISAAKFEDKQRAPGWGYRYKVRIFGLHNFGEDAIKSQDLPWANIMYPTTAGAYLQNSGQTPMIRQGNIVFGFFLDGPEQEQPVIMGCLGNNAQTELFLDIGTNRVNNAAGGGKLGTSGYAVNPDEEKPQGKSAPTQSKWDQVIVKPKDHELAKELAPALGGVRLNQYGLDPSKGITEAQQKDINSARAEIEIIKESIPNFTKAAANNLIRKRVAAGMAARKKAAEGPNTAVHKGATVESEVVHLQTAADIQLDDICEKKGVLLKPTSIVDSCNRAIQTDMDNMVKDIDKYMNSLVSYRDAVSITDTVRNIQKVVKDSAKKQAKYMKPIIDNLKEYSEKKIEKELTKAVSTLPACKRWQFLDLKENMTTEIMDKFNDMTQGVEGLMEGVLRDMMKLDDTEGGLGLITQALEAFETESSINPNKSLPQVPICTSEDCVGAVLAANREQLETLTNDLLGGMNTFIDDMMKDLADVSGDAGGITELLSNISNIQGNITSALNFNDGLQNVFPFEKKPNEAVSDFYTFCGGGASQKQTSIPNPSSIHEAAAKIGRTIPDAIKKIPFAEVPKNQPNIDLTDITSLVGDPRDLLGIDT